MRAEAVATLDDGQPVADAAQLEARLKPLRALLGARVGPARLRFPAKVQPLAHRAKSRRRCDKRAAQRRDRQAPYRSA